MQAKPKIAKILVVALIVSLVLVACGGGTSGKTWFNLPSVTVRVQPNGAASVWGFNLGPVLQPAMVQQFQSANIQKLEVRIGYNGIHVYANGGDLPYVAWDQASVSTLQRILPGLLNSMNVPNGDLIVRLLPWLRTIGLGVTLDIAPGQGQSALTIPRWSGETAVTTESVEAPTLGPLTIGSLVFDPAGNAIVEGIPAATLQESLGVAIPALDPGTLGILQSIGAENFRLETHPNGIRLLLNDDPLPGIAYDSQSLGRVTELAGAFVPDPATLQMVSDLVTILPGAEINVAVSFTGEPAAETAIAPITAAIQADGSVNVFGFPAAPAATVPGDVIEKLQDGNVQQLTLQVASDGLGIASNEQALPKISWTDESLSILVGVAGPVAGLDPALLTSVLDIVRGTGLDIKVTVPAGEGAEVVEMPADLDLSITPPEPSDGAALIRLVANYSGATVQSIGGLSADELAQLGVTLPDLPPDVMTILATIRAKQVVIDTEVGAVHLLLDGAQALQIDYNVEALRAVLQVATPFLGDSIISEPPVSILLDEEILPVVPISDVDITLNLN